MPSYSSKMSLALARVSDLPSDRQLLTLCSMASVKSTLILVLSWWNDVFSILSAGHVRSTLYEILGASLPHLRVAPAIHEGLYDGPQEARAVHVINEGTY
eukprot:CAMPEP_0173453884 /NCGR_PEP_ID=MMETSP1357-20121228/51435_1 /TAXON_ID=77926 /ORGANISM="Hemiselmis rufescens, Strain PCC563" /LENGTH=99 /DNA_ID=CAMNT_0014420883 /DNA_START=72 /DNA_END=367 /DNA_ORIENTATION=-